MLLLVTKPPNCKRCKRAKSCLYALVLKGTPGALDNVPLCYMFDPKPVEVQPDAKKER